jgi:hypothetical protein
MNIEKIIFIVSSFKCSLIFDPNKLAGNTPKKLIIAKFKETLPFAKYTLNATEPDVNIKQREILTADEIEILPIITKIGTIKTPPPIPNVPVKTPIKNETKAKEIILNDIDILI